MLRFVIAFMATALAYPAVAGSTPLNEWESIQPAGPTNAVGGEVDSGAIDSGGVALIVSTRNMIHRRVAADQPWETILPTLGQETIVSLSSIIAHPGTPGVLTAYASSSGGFKYVARSTDGGLTWTALLTSVSGTPNGALAVAPTDPNIIYTNILGTGLLKTTDGGQTWITVSQFPPESLTDLNVDPGDANKLYGLGARRIYMSVNGGLTFAQSDVGIEPAALPIVNDLAIDYAQPGTVYAASSFQGVVFKSQDSAASWVAIALPDELDRGAIGQIAIDPANSDRVFASTGVDRAFGLLVVSDDAGATWSAMEDPQSIGAPASLFFAGDGSSLTLGKSGVGRLEANVLLEANQGFNNFVFQQLRPVSGDIEDRFYGAGPSGVVATTPSTPLWESRRGPALRSVKKLFVDPTDPERLYVSSRSGLLSSTDGGRSWNQITVPGAVLTDDFEASPINADIVYVRDRDNLFVSVDAGVNWSESNVMGDLAAASAVDLLVASPVESNVALLGTSTGSVFATFDTGQTWAPLDVPVDAANIWDLEFDPKVASRFYVAGQQGIWRTDDAGSTWFDMSPPNVSGFLIALVADPVIEGRLFAIDLGDIWAFDPRDGSWRSAASPPPSSGSLVRGEVIVGAPVRSGRLYYMLTIIHQIQLDTDEDGIGDDADNCILTTNPSQIDADTDGIGNACDADIAPAINDCVVNVLDLGVLRAAFFSVPGGANWNAAADFNADDVVNVVDLGILRAAFFGRPGYSGHATVCQ